MSLLLPNQLIVKLSIESVTVIHRSRGLRRQIMQQQNIAIALNEDLHSEKSVWLQAIRTLEIAMAAMQIKPKTTLQIIIADDFVRYLILPSGPIPMSPAEKHAYALATYFEIYGAVADSWHIKLHDAAPNETTLAAAIDENLLETLKQVSLKHQLKLTSVQPFLMYAYNGLIKQVGKLNGYLVILESKRLLLLSMLAGRYQNLRTIAVTDDWQSDLKNLIARESLLDEITGKEILVYAPTKKNNMLNAIDGWSVKRIGQDDKKIVAGKPFALFEVAA